ncbi:MAG: gas vesicle protein [Bacillota bacterium]
MSIQRVSQSSNLAEILEKILDKGVVVAGDIKIAVADVELLTINIRLVICSVERAMEIGIDWWQSDPNLSTRAQKELAEREQLQERVNKLESQVARYASAAPRKIVSEDVVVNEQEVIKKALASTSPGNGPKADTKKTFGFNLEEKKKRL